MFVRFTAFAAGLLALTAVSTVPQTADATHAVKAKKSAHSKLVHKRNYNKDQTHRPRAGRNIYPKHSAAYRFHFR